MNQAIPLSLYIHIPWCVRKCPYCDFNSHAARGALPEAEYIDALLRDLDSVLPEVWGRGLDTVFIGGGTPSLFSAANIDRLLAGVRARLRLRPDSEVTLEANPGTLERGRFAEYRAAGVNRLSIGVQSFDDDALGRLGRIHSGAEALAAYESARQAGFERINLDLMFGLPRQSQAQALDDLARAIALAPQHLSWYQLTLEPNTEFHHRPPPLPDDDALAEMQTAGLELLQQAGYHRYEVSAFAQGGYECRHNRNYWEFGDYIGLGAGAHAKLTLPQPWQIRRRHKPRRPTDYLAEPTSHAGERTPDADELQLEFMLNALRLVEGVPSEYFAARTGLDLRRIEDRIALAVERELLLADRTRLCASPRGYDFLNDLLAIFM